MVFPVDKKLEYWHAHSHIWHERWLAGFFNKPCNSELFVRQSLNMEGRLGEFQDCIVVSGLTTAGTQRWKAGWEGFQGRAVSRNRQGD